MNRREVILGTLSSLLGFKRESEPPKAYTFNAYNQLQETKPHLHYCIFQYRKGQDTTKIEKTPVTVFRSKESLDDFVKSLIGRDLYAQAREKGITLIVRPVTIYN